MRETRQTLERNKIERFHALPDQEIYSSVYMVQVCVCAVVLLLRAVEVSRHTSLVASLSTEWSPYLMALAKTEPVPMVD